MNKHDDGVRPGTLWQAQIPELQRVWLGIARAIDGIGVSIATEHPTPLPGTGDHPALTLGYVMGTLMYMSPEQVTGECPLDGQSDVFALGGVPYEMVPGRRRSSGRRPGR